MDESESSRRQWRDAEAAQEKAVEQEQLASGKNRSDSWRPPSLDEATKQGYAKEERHEKSHAPAAAVFGVCVGTLGVGVITWLLKDAKSSCSGFFVRKTDPWCLYVNSSGFDPTVTPLLIGAIIGGLGYVAVYAYYYFTN